MFAVAIWDASRRRLVLARDRYGIKPLYYRHVGGELRFASELRALPRGEIDTDALEAFLAFNSIPAPYSIFRDVRKLPAGHVLVWENGSVTIERFARPGPTEVRDGDEAELVEELRARLRDSVKAHLLSDVPVGVLLSGGVDSAALAALAAQETPEPVHTFTIGFAEKSFDERDDARLVAQRYGTEPPRAARQARSRAPPRRLADAFDEPFADSSALPTYLVSQLAAEHVKVALSGEGGDELFGGYYTYAADLLADRLAPVARVARPLVEALPSSSSKASFDYRAKRFVRAAHLPPLERHHGWKEIFSPDARRELRGGANGFDPVDVYRARYAETAGAPELARLQDVDFGVYLVDDLLVKTDRASMAHSLEVRVPFLDPLVTNLAFALPTRLKVRGLQKKVLLRKAVEPLLPREIIHGKKRGFSIPAAAWLRGELEPFARATLSADTLRRQGFFQPAPVDAAPRRARRRPRGLEPAAVGAARVHALVRTAGRAGAAAPTIRPDGGARRMSDLPPFELGYPRTELRRQLVDAVLRGDKTATAGLLEEYEAEGETPEVPGARCGSSTTTTSRSPSSR